MTEKLELNGSNKPIGRLKRRILIRAVAVLIGLQPFVEINRFPSEIRWGQLKEIRSSDFFFPTVVVAQWDSVCLRLVLWRFSSALPPFYANDSRLLLAMCLKYGSTRITRGFKNLLGLLLQELLGSKRFLFLFNSHIFAAGLQFRRRDIVSKVAI